MVWGWRVSPEVSGCGANTGIMDYTRQIVQKRGGAHSWAFAGSDCASLPPPEGHVSMSEDIFECHIRGCEMELLESIG